MPTILVKSNASTEQGSTITLEETVEPDQLASDDRAAEFIMRVGWALTEAQDAEESSDRPSRSAEEPPYDPRRVERDVYEKLYGQPKRVDRVAWR